ncbi:MAG TPA: hypothetical protein PKX62_21065 [Spirochaetota bacterium]|nr:hypothetical protein [Spirochaetota bacterium]
MIAISKNISFTIFFNTSTDIIINNIDRELTSAFKSTLTIKEINSNELNYRMIHEKDSILKYKAYLYENENNKIIYFDNTGESYYSLIWNICLKNKLLAIHIQMSDDSAEYPGYMMHYFDGIDDKNKIRSVLCYLDSNKWVFYTKGEVKYFEDEKPYSARIKKNRFNRKMIIEYCNKLGCDITLDSFWKAKNKVFSIIRN